MLLPVMESFYTLQGEGFHQGRAAYFIRLGGCDVGCTWCDVKDSWDESRHPQVSISEIVENAKHTSSRDPKKRSQPPATLIPTCAALVRCAINIAVTA